MKKVRGNWLCLRLQRFVDFIGEPITSDAMLRSQKAACVLVCVCYVSACAAFDPMELQETADSALLRLLSSPQGEGVNALQRERRRTKRGADDRFKREIQWG